MDFGIVTAKIDEIGYIVHAENLGYSHCWVTDSQMIRSNCWAVLALAAQQTRHMRIGTGVNVPGLRLAPVTANGIATINRLAPGRTFISLGTGFTAMRTIGQKPMRLAEFEEYVRVVRALIDGEETDYTLEGKTTRIQFQMREQRFIDVEHPIPLYIAGYGPKAQALAGKLADGLVTGFPRGGTIGEAMGHCRAGAEAGGRALPKGFYTSSMVTLLVLQPGEPANSERAIAEVGPVVMTGMHYLAERASDPHFEPPAWARGVWKDYMAYLDGFPPEVRHQMLHGSHYSHLEPGEARFLTEELIRGSCVAGTPEELVEQLRQMERDGLNQVMLYPPYNRNYRAIEDFADQVMSRM